MFQYAVYDSLYGELQNVFCLPLTGRIVESDTDNLSINAILQAMYPVWGYNERRMPQAYTLKPQKPYNPKT